MIKGKSVTEYNIGDYYLNELDDPDKDTNRVVVDKGVMYEHWIVDKQDMIIHTTQIPYIKVHDNKWNYNLIFLDQKERYTVNGEQFPFTTRPVSLDCLVLGKFYFSMTDHSSEEGFVDMLKNELGGNS
jgi:hypothetical protein